MQDFGLVSRGDKSLQNSQESRVQFFDAIVKSQEHFEKEYSSQKGNLCEQQLKQAVSVDMEMPPEVAKTLHNLRILREALLKHKPDEFHKRVFLYSIRISASVCHYETYVASILYLLSTGQKTLNEDENREIVSLLVLHVSHSNNENYKALKMFFEYLDMDRDRPLYNLLQAWITDDYHTWIQHYNNESNLATHAVMSFGANRVFRLMVERMSKSYFSFPMKDAGSFLPRGENYPEFKKKYAFTWTDSKGIITIRSRR